MLTLTYENGRKLERHFCGPISSEEDIAKLAAEARHELETSNTPIFIEIWSEVQKPKITSQAPQ